MHKIKTHLHDYTHKLLKSYLYNRVFAVRCKTTFLHRGYPYEGAANNIMFEVSRQQPS